MSAKPKIRSLSDLRFSPEQMAGLANQAQSMYEPDPFDVEVQKHLDALHGIPEDSALSQQDDQNQRSIARQESIANPPDFGNPPVIPGSKAPKATRPAKSPNWDQDLPSS